ncbi:MAG: ComEA family DNA-binding protein [Erysipelotrichaceae bacterium]|nr:ComEA family DNA-binding protein [Erysipelotrichaceae bacterium]
MSVEIKGEVVNPGVYELILGSTLEDLFKEAGLKSDADTSMYAHSEVLHNSQVIVIKKHKSDLISINTADLDQLITLPGIGKSIAQRIIDYRNLYGSFNYLEELKNVNGIGDGKFNKIKEYICL